MLSKGRYDSHTFRVVTEPLVFEHVFFLVTQMNVYSRKMLEELHGPFRSSADIGKIGIDAPCPAIIHILVREAIGIVRPFHRVSFVSLSSNPGSRPIKHVQKRIGSCEEG
jgi:hypothetical protein